MAKKSSTDLIQCIEEFKIELKQSSWFSKVRKQIKSLATNCDFIRCLAIGEPKDQQVQYQIAFLLLLIDEYNCPSSVWDPILKKQDIQLFQELEIEVTKKNPTDSNCLWFVPHAPYFLEPEIIQKIGTNVYIGNNMTMYRAGSVRDPKLVEAAKQEWTILPLKEQKNNNWYQGFINTAVQQLKTSNQ